MTTAYWLSPDVVAVTASEDARMAAFHALGVEEQAEAIRRLAASGQGVHSIACATRLSVEAVLRVLEVGHGV